MHFSWGEDVESAMDYTASNLTEKSWQDTLNQEQPALNLKDTNLDMKISQSTKHPGSELTTETST